MPMFKVDVWYHNHVQYEVEAKDGERAGERAMERCMDEECPDEITDIEIVVADDQYTDSQELYDREERDGR